MAVHLWTHLWLLLSLLGLVLGEQKSYAGYRVLKTTPETEYQLNILKDLAEQSDNTVDFWAPPAAVGEDVTFHVPRSSYKVIRARLQKEGMHVTTLTNNLQSSIDKERAENDKMASMWRTNTFNLNIFNTHQQINNWLDRLNRTCKICETVMIGESYEGRDMKAIKIGQKGCRTKPRIWIDGGIHAREWIAPATALYLIDKLASTYESDVMTGSLLDTYDWIILPVANPDGYEYSRRRDRMWRKTRRPNPGTTCVGTDPNRNWDINWNGIGSSSAPCSPIFAGPAAFSEPETRAISEYLRREGGGAIYLALHSYGQYWLHPWGYTTQLPKDYKQLENAAKQAVTALKAVHGRTYTVGSTANALYPASGGADDWAKAVAGIKYSYTVELRGDHQDRSGFILLPSEIQPQGEEIWAAVKTLAKFLSSEYSEQQ